MVSMGKLKPAIKATLKWKVGYIHEDVSITRAKLAEMKIAEVNEGGEAEPSNSTKSD